VATIMVQGVSSDAGKSLIAIRRRHWLAWPVPAASSGAAHRVWQPGKAQITSEGGAAQKARPLHSPEGN
jgi:hypothetical protein